MKVILSDSLRPQHIYVVGKTGCGKSTLIHNCAIQDILQGKGVGVIDPDGDLSRALLDTIPKSRVRDCVYFDPEHVIPLSVMEAANEDEANDLADDLIVIFRRLSEGWGERMDSILRNCVHTLMRIPHSHFLQIYSLLTDHGWRKQWMHRLPEHVRMFWTREFPDYKPVYYQPILTR